MVNSTSSNFNSETIVETVRYTVAAVECVVAVATLVYNRARKLYPGYPPGDDLALYIKDTTKEACNFFKKYIPDPFRAVCNQIQI